MNKLGYIDYEYCKKCDDHVEADYYSYSTIGMYGTNVYCKVYCKQCGELIREKLIDKDI